MTSEFTAFGPTRIGFEECDRIADFLDSVVLADIPEIDVPALTLPGVGLVLDVVGSDELLVEMTIRLPDLSGWGPGA